MLRIPDSRLYEDPLIPKLDDYRKREKLQRIAETRSFAELVAYYWTLPTYPPTPADLTARFIGAARARAGRRAGTARVRPRAETYRADDRLDIESLLARSRAACADLGVGFIPRRLMPGFVRWRRGLAYTGKTLLSRFELSRMARCAGYEQSTYRLPPIAPQHLRHASRAERMLAPLYDSLRRIALLRNPMTVVFPALLAVLTGRTKTSAPA